MKKRYIIPILILMFTSCGDNFLDLYPESNSSEGSFYKTEEHFTQGINSCYSSLRGVYNTNSYLMGEMRSDNTHYTHYANDRGIHIRFREDIANFTVDPQNDWIGFMWRDSYVGIARCNTVLGRIGGTGFSEEFKNSIIGQAKFLRAFLYFQLVQNYGRIPLQVEEVTNEGNAFSDQGTVEGAYALIVEDVKDAISKLPVAAYSKDGYASGAATKGAAQMLYAYVLMTKPERDYTTAVAQLTEVLKDGSGYGLMDTYADVFDTSKKNSKEHIFSVQYLAGDQGQQSNWFFRFIPKTIDAVNITGVATTNTIGVGGFNVPTQAMIDSYEDGDERLNVSIAIACGEGSNKEQPNSADNGMNIAKSLLPKDPEIATYKLAIPYVNKYKDVLKNDNQNDNWPVLRYADALLLMAECLVEQGKAGEAASYVNRVRNRAGLANVKGAITADVVALERKHELAFENHRWYDIVRNGTALKIIEAHGAYIRTVDANLPKDAYQNLKPGFLVYPIPYRELQVNRKLTQNPDYAIINLD